MLSPLGADNWTLALSQKHTSTFDISHAFSPIVSYRIEAHRVALQSELHLLLLPAQR